MSQEEWWVLVKERINRYWPHLKLRQEDAAAQYEIIADFRGIDVEGAIRHYYCLGERFPPTAGQLYRLLVDRGAPTFTQAWKEIVDAAFHYGARRFKEIRWSSAKVKQLASAIDWSEFCTSDAPRTVWESQLRRAWADLSYTAQQYPGLPEGYVS